MNNKGLEALAALASASSHRNDPSNNNNNNGSGSSAEGNSQPAGPIIDLQSIVNLTAALQQQQQQHQQQQGSRNTATINQQILSQALNSGMNPAALAALLQGLNAAQNVAGINFNNNSQQFDLMNILASAQSGQQQQLPANNHAASPLFSGLPPLQNQALQVLLSGRSGATNGTDDSGRSVSSQVLPRSSSHPPASPNRMSLATTTTTTTTTGNNMPPPQSSNLQASVGSLPAAEHDSSGNYSDEEPEGKKQMKRAANRKSAQLSRKRKKQFIEELKEENDGLRRKEQILRSIPDLVVVFDSSGKLWFVSESVERFLSFTASELEGTSFWDRLSPDSVRILKAAFMDSLAARESVSDTVQLGAGVWELELVDQSNTNKRVSLNGVVHFAGERPECVCSIRPLDANHALMEETDQQQTVSKPNVMLDNASKRIRKRGDATRISDSGNSSSGGESESDETGGNS